MVDTYVNTLKELLSKLERDDKYTGYPMENGKSFVWSKDDGAFWELSKLKHMLFTYITEQSPDIASQVVKGLNNQGYRIEQIMKESMNNVGVVHTSKGIITFIFNDSKIKIA